MQLGQEKNWDNLTAKDENRGLQYLKLWIDLEFRGYYSKRICLNVTLKLGPTDIPNINQGTKPKCCIYWRTQGDMWIGDKWGGLEVGMEE